MARRQVVVLLTPTLAKTVSLGPYFAFVLIDFFSLLYSPLLVSKRMDLAHGARDNQSYVSFILNQKFRDCNKLGQVPYGDKLIPPLNF